MIQWASVLIPTLILLISVVEDLRTKKVRNQTVLLLGVVALAVGLGLDGFKAIPWSLLSVSTAFFLGFPLFMFGILGAGDIKVFMAFSVLVSWDAVMFVGVASLVWGAALGIGRSILSGQGRVLAANTWGLIRYQRKPMVTELTHIPYTVALLFGWASYLVQVHPQFWGAL